MRNRRASISGLALMVACSATAIPAASTEAASVFFRTTASNGMTPSPLTLLETDAAGAVYVMVDTGPEGFGVSVASSAGGVIGFTGATVFNPTFSGGSLARWLDDPLLGGGVRVDGVSADGIDELLGASLSPIDGTVGLDPTRPAAGDNGQPNFDVNGNFVFAQITFDVLGTGVTELSLGLIDRPGDFLSSGDAGDVAGQVLLGTATIEVVSPLAADFNADGAVDLADLTILGNGFGAASGASPADGDANGDGAVDLADLTILGNEFGQTASATPGLAAVPEPGAAALMGGLLGAAALRRRRRNPAERG